LPVVFLRPQQTAVTGDTRPSWGQYDRGCRVLFQRKAA